MGNAAAKRPTPSMAVNKSFILYALGISVWMALVSCLGSTYMHPLLPDNAAAGPYVISQQCSYVLSYFVFFILIWRRKFTKVLSFWKVTVCALSGSMVLLAAVITFPNSTLLAISYGIAMGIGITSGYMHWIQMVSERPLKEIVPLLFMASVASILSGIAFAFIPSTARLGSFFVLVLASFVLMKANANLCEFTNLRFESEADKDNSKRLASEMTVPIVCAVALVIVAPIVSTSYIDPSETDLFRTILAQIANFATISLLAIIYFGLKRTIRIFDAYCALLPIMTSAVLIAAAFEPDQRWFVLFFGDVCFCIISFLTLLTSCETSKRLKIPVAAVYGLLGGSVYLARFPGVFLVVDPSFFPTITTPFAIAAMLLYMLAMPAFFLPFFNRKAKQDWSELTRSFTVSDIDAACDNIASKHRLPPRQAEVLKLLAAGHSIEHISKELCLSGNTVKTYRKAIYAALDVHSRQALLDLVHEKMQTPLQ